jgi:hypothetical protein
MNHISARRTLRTTERRACRGTESESQRISAAAISPKRQPKHAMWRLARKSSDLYGERTRASRADRRCGEDLAKRTPARDPSVPRVRQLFQENR